MFEPDPRPRLFGLPPGTDFPAALVAGLRNRLKGQPPEALARVEVYVNTRRMERRLTALFTAQGAALLPRIRLITDLGEDPRYATDLPPAVPALRRRLELSQLVLQLLQQQPDLAPRAALFDLSDSLAALMDEMQGEGVDPQTLARIDVGDLSDHWRRSLQFLNIVARYFGPEASEVPDAQARQRQVIERLTATWAQTPPKHPIIVAGSTGSRGATLLFLQAVARLPQGAVVLPGYDFDMPAPVWSALDDAQSGEDHPQFRFRNLMRGLDLQPKAVLPWLQTAPANPARNALVSLALRPAPITDQWLREGPALADLPGATDRMTLIEAPSDRAEALAIALGLRQAAEAGRSAALITPDRMLSRQVTAALARWGIEPDDSAGRPLGLSAPGRLLRHVAALFGTRLDSEALLVLLKHPLTHSGRQDRGAHLLRTHELELTLRRNGPVFPKPSDLLAWAADTPTDAGRADWAVWLAKSLDGLADLGERSLRAHLDHHITLSEQLAGGPDATGSGGLWEREAGAEALRAVTALRAEADAGGSLNCADYTSLFSAILAGHEVRDPVRAHPDIMIWGTLEARVQGADLVILGGLNDGIWPQSPTPDPWLSRQMRLAAGLLLPERRIGLSAHDFQQAIAAPEVWLTRSVRDAEAETVPSRWLNRLTNLLGGISPQSDAALGAMRVRGGEWVQMATRLELPAAPVPPAPRPSPRPPVAMRPRQLSVTRVQTLIRDPYAIYAQYILGLKALDPLRQTPDAPLRGTLLHRVFHRFIDATQNGLPENAHAVLMGIADSELLAQAPWPAARRMWRAQLLRVADWFIATEHARRRVATPHLREVKGALALEDVDFTLTCIADRIDRTEDGALVIYDYKSGKPPSEKQMTHFDKQLLLEAWMAERGAFEGLAEMRVAQVEYIGLGSGGTTTTIALEPGEADKTGEDLQKLINKYRNPHQGYTARRAMEKTRYAYDYDQLARYGEWDVSDKPAPEDLT